MKVRATKLGYYNHKRQHEGMEFHIKDEKAFSENWMELLDEAPAPKKARSKKVSKKSIIEDSDSEVI